LNSDLIPIGYLIKPHGLKGELKVFLYNKKSQTLDKGIYIWLKKDNKFESFLVENIRGLDRNIIKLKDLNDRNDCNIFLKEKIYVTRDDFPAIDKNEFYLSDLIGFSIYNINNEPFGSLVDILNISKQDILVIKFLNKEVLLPNNKNFVKLFDFENKKIIVDKIEQFIL